MYTMTLRIVEGKAFELSLREEPYQGEIHAWSKAFDPDLDQRSQIVGLLQAALLDLDQALALFQIRVAKVEAGRDHVPLWNFSGQITKLVVEGFHGGRYFHTFPGGKINDTLAEMEREEFNRLTIHCERAPAF
ncbi:hypothetical protein HY630_01280 [Candidatus Uhrbacteria bacterium]|nr:hypothetical protein [Candidatus Uhrbacteria bacterium]